MRTTTAKSTAGITSAPVRRWNVELPDRDVRHVRDESVRRGWTEASRRALGALALFVSDSIAGVAAVYTVLHTWPVVSANGLRPVPNEVPLLAMVFCLQPVALSVVGSYGGGKARSDLVKIACGVSLAAFLGWIQARLFGRIDLDLPDKAAYMYAAFLITTFVWIDRVLLDEVVRIGYRKGVLQRRVLVVATEAEAEDLCRRCSVDGSELRIVGRVDPDSGELRHALSSTGAQAVIITSSLGLASLKTLVRECFVLRAGVYLIPQVLERMSGAHIEVRQNSIGSFLHLQPTRLELPQMTVKRAMDIALTSLVFAATWPLFVAIAVAIKWDSEGPVLFTQMRAGVGGKPFRMLKFRTMHVGAEEQKPALQHLNASQDPRLFKIRNDPRVTRVGRLLRRTSLDELPQLFNVLKGEMSLVGPRPFFPGDIAVYERHHLERLHVLPGMTGLWQINGRSNVVDFEQVIRLDREYVENWSVLADISILLRTIPAVLSRGAY